MWYRITAVRATLGFLLVAFVSTLNLAMADTASVQSSIADDEPIRIQVALRVMQIGAVDQQSERFTAVVEFQMKYQDSALAYERPPGAPSFRLLTLTSFRQLTIEKGTLEPQLVFDNQQGRLADSAFHLKLRPDGSVHLFERFTSDFQVPGFDFRRYPLDEQVFFIELSSLLPIEYVRFEELPDASGVSPTHGEEEWVVYEVRTESGEVTNETGERFSRFRLEFHAHRHLTYYFARIILPLFIILMVSWFTCLVRDYSKRVDLGITTLLLLIAFNFAVSDDLPKLGYLTAMDAFLTGALAITGTLFLINVMFRRFQVDGREHVTKSWDRGVFLAYWPAYILGMSASLLWL